jgi:hypothetical protein
MLLQAAVMRRTRRCDQHALTVFRELAGTAYTSLVREQFSFTEFRQAIKLVGNTPLIFSHSCVA